MAKYKAKINCGCPKCCDETPYGGIAPHRITITRGKDGIFRACGHAIDGYEIIGSAHRWDDIRALYADYNSWCLDDSEMPAD